MPKLQFLFVKILWSELKSTLGGIYLTNNKYISNK